MKRRNFLKSCLTVPFVFTSTVTAKPKGKKIEMYVPREDKNRKGCVGVISVRYTGNEQVRPGNCLIWNDDGTVSKPKKFAGVVK